MSDLRDLYQELILNHSKRPRNFGALEDAQTAHGHNPLCGDEVTVYVVLDGEVVTDVHFEGSGCAISTAAASMMTQVIKGKTRDEVNRIFERYHEVCTGRADPDEGVEDLGKLAVFAGVSEYPVRVKCATLAWHTLKAAMDQAADTVTTE